MRKAREVIPAIAMATALTACSGGPSLAPVPDELQASFNAGAQYWDGIVDTGTGDIVLEMIRDGARSCGNVNVTNNQTSALTTCTGGDTERIVVAYFTYQRLLDKAKNHDVSPEAAAAAAVLHELGHHLIHSAGMYPTDGEEERVADCLAGVAMGDLYPEYGTQGEAFFGMLGGGYHGTDAERAAAFMLGFTSAGDIDACEPTLTVRLGIPDMAQIS